MLQIRNLTKIYRMKNAPEVRALDSVSLSFPTSGMVFLLGKSGSGKSTLLNLLGGLDSYDSGEIWISGSETKRFRQSDFDSYRNTLVGFIFQEYNVLEEFTVGANIALSLELQGKKATDEEVSRILEQVDLAGYGARKPNELSGGQKQRVAIARALVKNPKIIMADEPTGALDSVTGKQIFDTLKKLSAEKLVIVVSHDRDFACQYADRIIELADGRVISDEEYFQDQVAFSETGISYGEGEIKISAGYRLTEEDREKINAYLVAMEEGKSLRLFREEKKIRKTEKNEKMPLEKSREPLKLIPSRLPMKVAFRIGSGALKHKKFRLAFSIFLSVIAFGLFGLADTFGAYDHITTCITSLMDSQVRYASVAKAERRENDSGESYYIRRGKLQDRDLEEIFSETGIRMNGVYSPNGSNLDFKEMIPNLEKLSGMGHMVYATEFLGFSEIKSEEDLLAMGMELMAGTLPNGKKNELLLSEYVCESFILGGISVFDTFGNVIRNEEIKKAADLVGCQLILNEKDVYTVSGVVSSGFDFDRYRSLAEEKEDDSTAGQLLDYALLSELEGIRNYSLCQIALVGEGFLEAFIQNEPKFQQPENGYLDFSWKQPNGEFYGFASEYYGTLKMAEGFPIAWVEERKTALAKNEIVISLDTLVWNMGLFFDSLPMGEKGEVLWNLLSSSEQRKILDLCAEFPPITCVSYSWDDNGGISETVENVKIVGIITDYNNARENQVTLVSDELFSGIFSGSDGIYKFAVGAMPESRSEVKRFVEFSYREGTPVRYEMQNPVAFELDAIHEILIVLSDVFLYIGLGFALFASLMMANFIGTSVAYKKQQIGILRAIGARSNDVFRIFFSESFCIAMINFVLSSLGTLLAVLWINDFFRSETGILVTLLTFSFRQVMLLFAVSVGVAFVASFLPVKKFASKKPIDAIRGK